MTLRVCVCVCTCVSCAGAFSHAVHTVPPSHDNDLEASPRSPAGAPSLKKAALPQPCTPTSNTHMHKTRYFLYTHICKKAVRDARIKKNEKGHFVIASFKLIYLTNRRVEAN